MKRKPGGGRHTKYNEKIQKQLEKIVKEYDAENMTVEEFFKLYTRQQLALKLWNEGDLLKQVSATDLTNWTRAYSEREQEKYKDFYEVMMLWEMKKNSVLARIGFDFINKPTAWIFLAKVHLRWQDTKVELIVDKPQNDADLGGLDKEALEKELAKEVREAKKVLGKNKLVSIVRKKN